MWRGGVVQWQRKKNTGVVLNVVLIRVTLDGFIFKYEVNKMSERKRKLKYFRKDIKQQRNLLAIPQLRTN